MARKKCSGLRGKARTACMQKGRKMKLFRVTYEDEIEARTIEDAYSRLLEVLASDVKYRDVEAFNFKEISPKERKWQQAR